MSAEMARLANLAVIFGLGMSWTTIHGFQPADFESDWLLMESQSTTNYFREIAHGLGDVPLKVKVLVRPSAGAYKDWVFEAGTSQQADDDSAWLYCGVLYTYNVTHVQLFAPKRSSGNDGGRAFCIDSASWTSGTNSSTLDQVEQQVLAKTMAWKESSFPTPDMDTGWIGINSADSPHFTEISHNLQNDVSFIHVQIRCNPLKKTSQTIYAEGTGAGSDIKPDVGEPVMSGLIYAYNETHVRIWIANSGYRYHVLCIRDGYARDSDGYRCTSGTFRVRAWTSLGQQPERFSFTLNGLNPDTIPDMSALKINIRHWDSPRNYVLVQVKALDGPNAHFVFPAVGQAHKNAFRHATYGGVVFAYSAENIRLFVPANDTGSLVHIPENWGTPEYNQISNNVQIIVSIWTTTDSAPCSNYTFTIGKFSRLGAASRAVKHSTKCAALCMAELRCVGIVPRQPPGQCEQMDLDAVNKRLIEGDLGGRGEALLGVVTCK